jgi:hypothetical protein
MSFQDDLSAIFDRIANGKETEGYLQALRELFRKYNCLDAVQLGKYNINIGQGQDIHIGDRTYVTWNDEAIQALIEVVQKQHPKPIGIPANLPYSGVVEFVGRDQVMSQLHQMLQQSYRVAVSAIAGMGGVGKTELALQYALKYQSAYPAGICWLSARSVDVGTQIVQFGRSLLNLNPPDDKDIIIKNLNIGHDWHFTDAHKELLGQYYDASKLILHCLNQNCAVSSNVKCEIEQTLLLLIAEIKKRKGGEAE